jgi:hypothetical protein
VVTGSVVGSSGAAFDVHSEAVDVTFVNCSTAGARYGEDSSGGDVGLRGTRTRAINPTIRQSANGVQFFAQTGNDSIDCEVINLSYISSGQPIRIGELGAAFTITRPKVRGGYIRTSHATVGGVVAWNCNGGLIEDLLIAPNGSTNGVPAISLGGNAELIVRNLTIDLTGYTGTQFRAFAFSPGTTGNNLIVEGVRIIGASGKFQYWFHGQSTSASSASLTGLRSDAEPTLYYTGVGSLDSFNFSKGGSIYVTDVAPTRPMVNDIWIDIS